MTKLRLSRLLMGAGLLLLLLLWGGSAQAQDPIPVQLPSATPTGADFTETPTQTPTQAGPVTVEANTPGTNIRAQPDINSERIGQISPGQNYVVNARRFNWYQIQFPEAPSGIGWVYFEVVTVTGEIESVPELGVEQIPTENLEVVSGRETQAVLTLTPGAVATLTAEAQITPTGLLSAGGGSSFAAGGAPVGEGEFLPTFTFPPFTATPIDLQQLMRGQGSVAQAEELPPLLPIVGLLSLGALGLMVSLLRRG